MNLKDFIEYAKIIEKYEPFLTELGYEIIVDTSCYDDGYFEISIDNELQTLASLSGSECTSIGYDELEQKIKKAFEENKNNILKQINEKQHDIKRLKYMLNSIDKYNQK